MSVEPYACEDCQVPGQLVRAGKYPESAQSGADDEATYGVAWRCPSCNAISLDLCPLGPIEPEEGRCLNCGEVVTGNRPCSGCGMTADEVTSFLKLPSETPSLDEAERLFDQGLFRRGFALADVLLRSGTATAAVWAAKATQYQILRLNKAAARCYRRSLALDAAQPLIEIALACAQADAGDVEAALATYTELLTRLPTGDGMEEARAIAHANRGNLHVALGRTDLAKADFEAALASEPRRVTHYQNYILAFTRTKRWADALAIAERGIGHVEGTERAPLLVELARSHNELEHAEEGLRAADDLLALVPEHPRGLYHRAWALGLAGRLDEAKDTLEKLLLLEPESKDAKKALAKIEAGRGRAKKPWWKVWGSS